MDGPWLVELDPGQKREDFGGGVLVMRRSDVDLLLEVTLLGATGCWCPLPEVERERLMTLLRNTLESGVR